VSSADPAELAVAGLRFRYRRGGEELFGGLTHQFVSGAVTAVTGPSGRGKSTLLYLLGLMLRPSAGTISLRGEPVADLPDATRSALRALRFGFVFQDAVLDPHRSILDSVTEPARYAGTPEREARTAARALLTELGLAHRAQHRPGEISGGQAQRVAVCRALVNNPAIVLADEPTGNLDRDNAAGVLDALSGAAAGNRTVIIATHDPFVLDRVDQLVSL
jgi:lipoprotein-releasing system ATP-binding protein